MRKPLEEIPGFKQLVVDILNNENIKVSLFSKEGRLCIEVTPINNSYGYHLNLTGDERLINQEISFLMKAAHRTIERQFSQRV